MNNELSSKLLTNVMQWDLEEVNNNMEDILFMSYMKYDGYGQYMPGSRFMPSFVKWLNEFEIDERRILFEFIKKRLIYISNEQMMYLVELIYSKFIKYQLIKKATEKRVDFKYRYSTLINDIAFKEIKRKALILGLSDGAHTDVLRRTGGFSNEQVLTFYYPSESKINDMLGELKNEFTEEESPRFTSLYLIDDFTASGTSFIRKANGQFKGKLSKILNQFCDNVENRNNENESSIKKLFGDERIDVHICFCIATETARKRINDILNQFVKEKHLENRITWELDIVQLLNDDVKINEEEDSLLIHIIKQKKYLDPTIVTNKSFQIGKYEKAYLGFDEGALPLVLSHNTPNNSIPILWQLNEPCVGLFPRINRH
jgi:arsenate reductase-like glutaredoxin family protein